MRAGSRGNGGLPRSGRHLAPDPHARRPYGHEPVDRRGVVLDDLQVDDDERDLHAALFTQRNETSSFLALHSNFGVTPATRRLCIRRKLPLLLSHFSYLKQLTFGQLTSGFAAANA